MQFNYLSKIFCLNVGKAELAHDISQTSAGVRPRSTWHIAYLGLSFCPPL